MLWFVKADQYFVKHKVLFSLFSLTSWETESLSWFHWNLLLFYIFCLWLLLSLLKMFGDFITFCVLCHLCEAPCNTDLERSNNYISHLKNLICLWTVEGRWRRIETAQKGPSLTRNQNQELSFSKVTVLFFIIFLPLPSVNNNYLINNNA